MDAGMLAILLPMLEREEGTRLLCYDDATGANVKPGYTMIGHPSIGIGRCLDTCGITQIEATVLLAADCTKVCAQLDGALPWWRQMSPNRQAVLAGMGFQMGVAGLLGFKGTLKAMEQANYNIAAAGMLTSRWATQTPARAQRMAGMMRSG